MNKQQIEAWVRFLVYVAFVLITTAPFLVACAIVGAMNGVIDMWLDIWRDVRSEWRRFTYRGISG